MEKVKEGIVLEFLHLEFTSHVQSYPSHTWTDFDIPLGSEQIRHPEAFENLWSRRGSGPGVDTTCSLLHFGAACTLLSASQSPGQRLFWVRGDCLLQLSLSSVDTFSSWWRPDSSPLRKQPRHNRPPNLAAPA